MVFIKQLWHLAWGLSLSPHGRLFDEEVSEYVPTIERFRERLIADGADLHPQRWKQRLLLTNVDFR